MSSKTDWAFHRQNYASKYPNLSTAAYAREFGLNPNTSRVRLAGALDAEAGSSSESAAKPRKEAKGKGQGQKEGDRKGGDRSPIDRSQGDRSTGRRSATTGAEKDEGKSSKKSTRYRHGRPGGDGTRDRSPEKREVIQDFAFPALGESFPRDHAGGWVSLLKLDPDIQEAALALSQGIGGTMQLAMGRYLQMRRLQSDMVADIEEAYSGGQPWQMEGGIPMPKSVAMSQAHFGPGQRMAELESVITRMQAMAANEHPLTKAQRVRYLGIVMDRREEEDLTAIETARLLEAKGIEVPKALLAEVQHEVSLIEPKADADGGVTDEELEAQSRAYSAKLQDQRGPWLDERREDVEEMLTTELAAQQSNQLDEDDFAAELAALDDMKNETPLTPEEDVTEDWG